MEQDTKGIRSGPNVEVKCKIDTGTGTMLYQFLFSGGCMQQCLILLGML